MSEVKASPARSAVAHEFEFKTLVKSNLASFL